MLEECEFRIDYDFASILFDANEGKLIGDPPYVQTVRVSTSDPRYIEIGELQRKIRAQTGRPFYYGWKYHRKYTQQELSSAELFYLNITARFEPVGEECGTIYDESIGCHLCHGGEEQTTPLILNCKSIPKNMDLCSTIADEWIVSERLANQLIIEQVTGFELRQVHDSKNKSACKWYQLIIVPKATLSSQTTLGDAPFEFDPDGINRCAIGGPGHTNGLNLLSEVYIQRSTWAGEDFCCTHELMGDRCGVLRPLPVLLISPRLRTLLINERVKKFETEIAYLV